MSKKSNPMFKSTQPAEPEVLDDQIDDNDRAALIEMPLPGDTPLTKKEEKRLRELETVVTRNFKAFYDVGCALREINDKRLYRQTHQEFGEYCNDLWDMVRSRAYQMIDAADVVDNVRNCAQIENVHNCGQNEIFPQNEAQARVLVKYKNAPEKQIEISRAAIESAENGKITAAHIRATARRLYNEKVKKTVKKAKKKATKAPKMSDAFRTALMALYEQIDVEREAEWANTDRDEVARQLRGLVEVVEADI